jgi:hypothetical protein
MNAFMARVLEVQGLMGWHSRAFVVMIPRVYDSDTIAGMQF